VQSTWVFVRPAKNAGWLNKPIQGVTTLVTQSDNFLGPVSIKVENSGCIDFCKYAVEHERTENIGILHHFVRHAITTDKFILDHYPTDEMAVDPITDELAMIEHDERKKTIGHC